ncbi:MAG: cardiolipin synthase [Tissierellia bacterium]|nr:cardiolipin synthase [Tissierellia bacterium]
MGFISADAILIVTKVLGNLAWINILLSLGIIFIERKDPRSTLMWVMVLNFLPGIGFLAYLYLGKNVRKSRLFVKKGNMEIIPKSSLETQLKHMNSNSMTYHHDWINTHDGMIKMNLLSAKSLYSDNNDIDLFFDGQDLFERLVMDLEAAKESIDIQYYIFKSDAVGNAILEVIEKKAIEGVKVRILLDGMGGRNFSIAWRGRLERVGAHVVIFFPPALPWVNVRINYRNHRKIVVIDGEVGYIGGFNVGNEYLSLAKRFGYWRDTHIRVVGDAVNDLWRRFYNDLAFAENYRENIDIPDFDKPKPNVPGVGLNIVSSGPDSLWPSIRNAYSEMIHVAKKRLYIQTPYFIPDEGIMNALKIASLSGCDVRIMIPNKPDHPFVYWATLSHAGELLQTGVKIYTYERGFLHTKTMIADDVVTSIGTANMDIRSFYLNFEVNAFIYDKTINEKLTDQFYEDLKYCKEMTLEEYTNRSKWVIIKESVSRLFSPIL